MNTTRRPWIAKGVGFGLMLCLAWSARASIYTLDAPGSPVSVVFNDAGAQLSVSNTSNGFVWKSPDSGGGSAVTVNSVSQPGGTNLTANITIGGQSLTLALGLDSSNGELSVSLDGTNANLGGGVIYPYPFFPTNGLGFAVVPVDSGYVVPTSNTSFAPPGGQRCMEWFGGTDTNNAQGWLGIVDTPDDYALVVHAGNIAGQSRLGAAPKWWGSNDNPAHTSNLLSYERTVRYRFLTSGGYVALAKQFRQSAAQRGWLTTLAQKQHENPSLNLSNFIGSPICYLWGDGRSTNLLNAMTNAGITRAHLQVSINNVDEYGAFPATNLLNNAWFDAVRAHGYSGGIYDIYAYVRHGGQPGSPYDGYYYLWPSNAWPQWLYVTSSNMSLTTTTGSDTDGWVSYQQSGPFAVSTRLAAHVAQFDLDACFFDVVCAADLTEDYDNTYGHFATRSMDRTNRFGLLSTGFTNAAKLLITGTEQGRSWAVPTLHWSEGKFWQGAANLDLSDGIWNDTAYPQIEADVMDPTANNGGNQLANLLSDGYQAPLWDLVFHDCLVTTVHWQRCHNKYLYAWDAADLWAMLRGQAPLLNMTYAGVKGGASRQPNQLTNAFGQAWSSRWTVMSNRFVQTFTNVCRWQGQVGWMEMTDQRRLTPDRSVQMSEFSGNGGVSGLGIVVNFGVYDGAYSMTNATWSGVLRGQMLTVPADNYRTYAWSNAPPSAAIQVSATNSVSVNFLGAPQASYDVQASTDLDTWLTLATLVNTNTASSVLLQLVDTPAPTQMWKFYRVVMP